MNLEQLKNYFHMLSCEKVDTETGFMITYSGIKLLRFYKQYSERHSISAPYRVSARYKDLPENMACRFKKPYGDLFVEPKFVMINPEDLNKENIAQLISNAVKNKKAEDEQTRSNKHNVDDGLYYKS